MTSDAPPVRRGRPSVIDRDKVAATALRLWHENGFDATRWEDLAAATGVSARTLVRRYGSQTAMLDVSIDRAVAQLHASLAASPTADISTALADAITGIVGDDSHPGASMWATVIAREPALQTWLRTGYQPWIDAIATAIRDRRPDIDAAAAESIAAAFEAATSSALLRWAADGADGSSADRVRTALRWLTLAPEKPASS